MNAQEIQDLIALCKQNGVKRIKAGDIELEFHADAPAPMEMPQELKDQLEKATGEDLSPEEMLFLSAPQVASGDQVSEMLKRITGQG